MEGIWATQHGRKAGSYYKAWCAQTGGINCSVSRARLIPRHVPVSVQRGLWFSRCPAVRAVTKKHCFFSLLGPKYSSGFPSCINWFRKYCSCCLQLFFSCLLWNKSTLSRTDEAYCRPHSCKRRCLWKPLTDLWEPHTCRYHFTTYYCFYLLWKTAASQSRSLARDTPKTWILTLPLPSVCLLHATPGFPFAAAIPQTLPGRVTALLSGSSKPYVEGPPEEALV